MRVLEYLLYVLNRGLWCEFHQWCWLCGPVCPKRN